VTKYAAIVIYEGSIDYKLIETHITFEGAKRELVRNAEDMEEAGISTVEFLEAIDKATEAGFIWTDDRETDYYIMEVE
jgi:hypothetical protein